MADYPIKIKSFGERALLIEWPSTVDEEILLDILAFKTHLQTRCFFSHSFEYISSYNSLTIVSNKGKFRHQKMADDLMNLYDSFDSTTSVNRQYQMHDVPVCYDLKYALDGAYLAGQLNRSFEEIVKLHSQAIYTVFGLGFMPGFLYLGGLDERLHFPRKVFPRLKVMKGAVGIAGRQTGIYPRTSPGGWQIIGVSPVQLFDSSHPKSPTLAKPGDRIKFRAISVDEYEHIKNSALD